MAIVLLVAGLLVVSVVAVIVAVKNAPEAYEDENGFHLVWRNDRDDARNVYCLWLEGSEECRPDSQLA